jgi:Flp pilus assembly pilin Flp
MIDDLLEVLFGTIHDRKGVTSLEYAVLAVVVMGAVLAAASTISNDYMIAFNAIGPAL